MSKNGNGNGHVTEVRRPKFQIEKIWLDYSKKKYPGLVAGGEEYDQRRHCFFVGAWAAFGLVQKTPDSIFEALIGDCHAEIKAELTRESKGGKIVGLDGKPLI